MGVATLVFGHILTPAPGRRCGSSRSSPSSACSGMLFGAWYALGSLEAVPYVF